MSQSLENLYKNIEYNNPKKILWKWYSLVLDKDWKIVDDLLVDESYKLMSGTSVYTIKIIDKSKAV
jgi:hypothetical protein